MSESKPKSSKSCQQSTFGKYYLALYNVVETVGWSYLLCQTLSHFLNGGSLATYWTEVKWSVIVFQNAAVLEVAHAAAGLVPSGVAVTLAQVYSRVFLVCGVLLATRAAPLSPGLPLAVLCWALTEIVRYAYYALNLFHAVPSFLLHLRYSTFLLLYPLGITGELLCMYHSLEEIAEKQLFSIMMPNSWNFVFSYYHFMIFYMFLYVPLFPLLFGHMLKQRKKMLAPTKKNK